MCLPIDFCFGFGTPRTDDDLGPPSKHVPPPTRAQPNGAGHYHGNSYPTHGAAAAAEADRKASNDVRPRGAATGAGAQEKAAHTYAGADGALRQQPAHAGAVGTLKPQPAASNGRVAAADGQGARGVAQHNYHYYQPAHREDAADSYYPAATATADHEVY